MYDLVDADVCPTLDLMERLLGIDPKSCFALITQLRRAGLMQLDRLGLTMVGLAVATALPPTEPRPMNPPTPRWQAA